MNVERPSLDQLRVFALAAEAGSFSSAARRLSRTQSAVSSSLAALESQLGVKLFDRSGHRPRLTPAGEALLDDVRVILARADSLLARARSAHQGVEPELSLSVEAMFPVAALSSILHDFRAAFPTVNVRLYSETLGSVAEQVVDGTAMLGVVMMNALPPSLESFAMPRIRLIPVVAPDHPLARVEGRVRAQELAGHVQLVLADRSALTMGQDFLVYSPSTWRLSDLATKRRLLLAGMGFGTLPDHLVCDDIRRGRLVPLAIEDFPAEGNVLALSCAWRRDVTVGHSMRWMMERLRTTVCYAEDVESRRLQLDSAASAVRAVA